MKVSVCMITYNQEKYIRQAIEGVLLQQTNFDFELVIANDCSSDTTDSIIQNLIQNHPNGFRIKYFKQSENIGMMPNFVFAMQQCTAKYVALCEGDDYWIDPLKLKKQVDFLENNQEYVLCFHKVNILNTNNEIVDDFITKIPENYETLITLAQLGNYIHTPSVVFRNIIKEFPFEFLKTPIGDYFLYLLLAEHGKIKHLEEIMCVYRYGVGVFSSESRISFAKSNLNLYTCLVSYFEDEKIKKILLERQLSAVNSLEQAVKSEYKNSFVSNHLFFRTIKFLNENRKKPSLIFKKLFKKLKDSIKKEEN